MHIRRKVKEAIDFTAVLVFDRDTGAVLVFGMRLNTDVVEHIVEAFVVSLQQSQYVHTWVANFLEYSLRSYYS